MMLQLLKDLDSSVKDIESKLRQANLIKGHANNLKKLSLDVNKKIDIILEPNTPGEKQLNSGHVTTQFKKSEDALPLVASYRDDWFKCVRFEICDAS